MEDDEDRIYDAYREALAVKERQGVPAEFSTCRQLMLITRTVFKLSNWMLRLPDRLK